MGMEYQTKPLGGAGDALMVPPTNTRHRCNRLPVTYSFEFVQTPGSSRSTQTDTDTAMEMGSLSMAPGGPGTCHVALRANAPITQGSMSTPDLAATVARGVAATATELLEKYVRPPPVNEADRLPVNQAADAALRERLQRCLNASPWATPTSQPAPGWTSAFEQLGHKVMDYQQEDEWAPRPEMMPRKVECGRQLGREQESKSLLNSTRE